MKLHEFTGESCVSERDRVYVFADGTPYGPFCARTGDEKRHRRYANYDPTKYTNFDFDKGETAEITTQATETLKFAGDR